MYSSILGVASSAIAGGSRLSGSKTAAFLWKRLEKGATEDELVEALLDEYEASEEDARFYIKKFEETLNENGFLE